MLLLLVLLLLVLVLLSLVPLAIDVATAAAARLVPAFARRSGSGGPALQMHMQCGASKKVTAGV